MGTAGEFIAVLRQALTGSAVSFAGRQLRSAGFRATMTAPSPVPVLLAAMNPAMLRLAGRAADGVFVTWTPDYVRALRAAGVALPVVLTPGAAPGDVAGSRATITGLAGALGLTPRR